MSSHQQPFSILHFEIPMSFLSCSPFHLEIPEQGQTLHIFVVGEMEKLLSEALGSRPTAEKFAAHVVAFLVTNSCRLEQMQDGQLQVQNLGTCWRRRALEQLSIDRWQGTVTGFHRVWTRSASHSSIPQVTGCSVEIDERKPQSSAFLSSPAHRPLTLTRQSKRSSLRQLQKTWRCQAPIWILKWSPSRSRSRAGAEREQRAVAITARDKAEETPWPVKMLHDGMQASSSLGLYSLADGVLFRRRGWTSESAHKLHWHLQANISPSRSCSITSR